MAVGLSVLGALYLAYDLLGGQHGPLRRSEGRSRFLKDVIGIGGPLLIATP